MDSLTIQWERSRAICRQAEQAQLEDLFTDVTFYCDDDHHAMHPSANGSGPQSRQVGLAAHQAVLGQRSAYLRQLFSLQACCQCRDKACFRSRQEPIHLVLHDVERRTLQSLLQLLYTGTTSVMGEQERQDLASLAEMLKIKLPKSLEQTAPSQQLPGQEAASPKKPAESPARATTDEDEDLIVMPEVIQTMEVENDDDDDDDLSLVITECSGNVDFSPKSKKRPLDSAADARLGEKPSQMPRLTCVSCDFVTNSSSSLFRHSVRCGRQLTPENRTEAKTTPQKSQEPQKTAQVSPIEVITVKEEPLDEDNGQTAYSEQCQYCVIPFRHKKGLLRHYTREHFANHLFREFGHLPACPVCGKTFEEDDDGNRLPLLLHLGVDHGKVENYLRFCQLTDRDLSCQSCGEDFERPPDLVKHLSATHYAEMLERIYPFAGTCPMCEEEMSDPLTFVSHLAVEHEALFKVAPENLSVQLQQLRSCQLQVQQEKNHLQEERPTLDRTASTAMYNFDDLANPNLICPICERDFSCADDLRRDLVKHYLPHIRQRYRLTETSFCDCTYDKSSNDNILEHIVLSHDKLKLFVPKEVKDMLRGSGLFELEEEERAAEQTATPVLRRGRWGTRPTLPTHCGLCNKDFVKSSLYFRHICTTHLKDQIRKLCKNSRVCGVCQMPFDTQRQLYVHVGRKHGICDRYLKQLTGQDYFLSSRPSANTTPVTTPRPTPTLTPTPPRPGPRPILPKPPEPGNGAMGSKVQSKPRSGAGGFSHLCPVCQRGGFETWTLWKKHIFYEHVRHDFHKAYAQVGKICPHCKKDLKTTQLNIRHIAVIHNELFKFLPADMHAQLVREKLTYIKARQQFSCPLCNTEEVYGGLRNFKEHLFSHFANKLKRQAAGAYPDNFCAECNVEVHADAKTRHRALEHGGILEFLPQEVVDSLQQEGVTFKKPKKAFPNNAAEELPVRREQASISDEADKTTAGSHPVFSHSIFHPSLPPSPSPQKTDSGDVTTADSGAAFTCPICQLSFPAKYKARRHVFDCHYREPLKEEYGHHGKKCPFCDLESVQITDNIRHIGFVHKKFEKLLSDEMRQRLEAAGIIDSDNPQASVTAAFPATDNGAVEEVENFIIEPPQGGVVSPVEDLNTGVSTGHTMCPVCRRQFHTSKLMSHISHHFRERLLERYPNPNDVNCSICSTRFQSHERFAIHMGTVHHKALDYLDRHARAKMQAVLPTSRRGLMERADNEGDGDGVLVMDIKQEPPEDSQEPVVVAPPPLTPAPSNTKEIKCVVCGLMVRAKSTYTSNYKRHLLHHYNDTLEYIVAPHQLRCPICHMQSHSPRGHRLHYFLAHRKYQDVPEIPDYVKELLAPQDESKSRFNYATNSDFSPSMMEQEQENTEGEQFVYELLPETDDTPSSTPVPAILPPPPPLKPSPSMPAVRRRGPSARTTYECSYCKKEFDLCSIWRNHLFSHFAIQLEDTYRDLGNSCYICQKTLRSESDHLRHLSMQHHRIFAFVDEQSQSDLLAVAASSFPLPTAKDDVLGCPLCQFKTGVKSEMREHVVCHYFKDIEDANRDIVCGSSCPLESAEDEQGGCHFQASVAFDMVLHLGDDHDRVVLFASERVKVFLEELK